MRRFVLMGLALVCTVVGFSQNLNRIEYFIDTEPGYGNGTNVPFAAAAAVNDLTFSVDIASITDGFHALYIRSRDANNNWSVVQARPFYKLPAAILTIPNLSRIEYFVDTDPGFGLATSVTFTAGTSLTDLAFTVPLTPLADGFHTLFIRSEDANNKWSVVQARPFYKVPAATFTVPNLSRIEYFVDTDPGYGAATSVAFTAGTSVTDLVFSVDVSTLSQGAHKLFVRSIDADNKWSIIQEKDFTVCSQAIPVASASTSITTTGFTANWAASSGATSYELDISTDNFTTFISGYNAKSVTAITQTVTGLIANTTYQIQVRAVGTCTSINSNVITVTTAPLAPVASAATAITATGFTANWAPVTGATGYQVEVSTDYFSSFVSGYNAASTIDLSLAITGLTASSSYQYRVRAVNAGGASANSNTEYVTTSVAVPAAPIATDATSVALTGFTANWGSVSNATGYQVDVSTASDFGSFVSGYNAATASGTSLAVTGLTAGTTYYYQVRATNTNGTSGNSNTITVSTSAGVPDIVIQQSSTVILNGGTYDFGSVTLSANTGDIVFTVSDLGTAPLVLNLAGSSLTGANASDFTLDLTNINSGTATVNFAPSGLGTRTAQLSIASNVTSKNPYVINLTGTGVAITAPVATDGTSITSTGFTANWGLVSDATGYLVDVSTANDFSSFVSGYNAVAASNTSLTVTGLTAGTTYFYQVRATNASSTSANSNVISVTTTAVLQAQTITFGTLANVTVGTSQITLTATASSGLAVTYTSSDNTIATVSGSTLTIVGAGSCTITADQAGNSDFSAAAPVSQTFCANPAQPTITLSGANSVSPTLTSSAASGNQWFLDGAAVSGATNSTFSVSQVGTYTVQVSVGTCQSTMSADEVLIVTGDIKSISTTQGINLYPNPARSLINISLENLDANESVNIQVFDMLGHNLQELFAEGGSTVSLDIANYAQGSYLIRATQSGNLFHSRFAKQ